MADNVRIAMLLTFNTDVVSNHNYGYKTKIWLLIDDRIMTMTYGHSRNNVPIPLTILFTLKCGDLVNVLVGKTDYVEILGKTYADV